MNATQILSNWADNAIKSLGSNDSLVDLLDGERDRSGDQRAHTVVLRIEGAQVAEQEVRVQFLVATRTQVLETGRIDRSF